MRFSTSIVCSASLLCVATASAQPASDATPSMAQQGPYNAAFLSGGIGIHRELPPAALLLAEGASFTLTAWVRPDAPIAGTLLMLGTAGTTARSLTLQDGHPAFSIGNQSIVAPNALRAGQWTHLAATLNAGTAVLYVDGRVVARGTMTAPAVTGTIQIAPVIAGHPHFGGQLVGARIHPDALDAAAIAGTFSARPDFDLVQMWHVGVGWEWQKTANTGYWRQQDPWTLPQSRGGYGKPVAKPVITQAPLEALDDGRWRIHGWQLAAAPDITASGAQLSRSGTVTGSWYPATVPGTVLTTLVDRGVYPDPYHGLNNMRIPESLARQDYWYRTSFTLPEAAKGKRLSLVFNGINYAGEAWVNGQRLGTTTGAFTRGRFTFTPIAGENVIAVRVSPPPHPGIPHEQSIAAGVGENGGQLAIDGPTFVATEGWDWIPGIRDRDTGLWQDVVLEAKGDVRLADPQIITDLPLPRTDSADVYISVPLHNAADAPREVTVTASFDDVRVEKRVTAPPGDSELRFAPKDFPALHVLKPRLWWPNGYGEQALHTLRVEADIHGSVSDRTHTRFGIREVSYDLSLMDPLGALRRVNVQPTDGELAGQKLIDTRHEAIKQSPQGWVESLTQAGEHSSAVRDLGPEDTLPEPHMTLRVNGVKIAARGGSWGMDDAMKRVSRARLEPYFRLHKEAHLNIIRNWMGNNTEPEFYDLADEYGLMVLNDFWQSTQNFQVEPQDPLLFLANARDTITRYRNHPSIVAWFGRNEGVPYPLLNEGLDKLAFELDGTRWYTGSSNMINLQGSGPYNYRPPVGYFTDLATGFSVETGTPSLSTTESVKANVPAADLWPISDTLAYHDWHFSGNGDTATFMASLEKRFSAATSFEDFERKAQMMNMEDYKAIFEGFTGHLWTKNSGRLLWMTHPAWPSNMWQIYSSDYDTNASYFGARKAAEPLHVQLNLPGNELVVVNTTRDNALGMTTRSRVLSLDGKELFTRTDHLDAPANRDTTLAALPLDAIFAQNPMVLVALTLSDAAGHVISDNIYWRGRDESAYRAMNAMPVVKLAMTQEPPRLLDHDDAVVVHLRNPSSTPALSVKLTLLDDKGKRILPAYYSDNYLALLPGEARDVTIRYPASKLRPHVTLRGWNVEASR
ncbi:MAG: beta galactosidase jelly roll domain-containing protein [Sphingomonadales bacterium]|nr:beta galactosidase jelly roll domain-containing protein [Sphingomonadales bacterium]MDE2170898.1 beta galactosidase jelly roll domain-containing protein [Sphingomonadales bacterium]